VIRSPSLELSWLRGKRLYSTTGETLRRGARGGYVDLLVLASLFLFHTINNWVWAVSNVTLLGWDRSSHLAKTLIYNDILQHINVRTLFAALTWPWNRPPLPFLTVVPFYRVFGVSTDIALMSNLVYLAVLLGSVYGIGRMLYDRRVGLFAAFLVSFYPVLFAISRLSYVDYALTAMVTLSIFLVLKSDGFRNRRWSLLFGLGLGLGLLTKWPFIAFAGAPVAYVAWTSGAVKDILFIPWTRSEDRSKVRRTVRSPWVLLALALLLSALWYLPNRDRLSGFLLGWWLPLLSWLLVFCTLFVLSRRPRPGANLLSAVMVGAVLASVWSLPNIGFSQRFVFVAYGGINIQGKGLSLLDPTFYARYLSMMLTEQLSPFFFVAFVIAICVLVYGALKGAGRRASWRRMSDGAWILTLWLVVPFLIFTLSQTWNSRFDIALLPAAALITARGLLELRAQRVRLALISLLVVCGVGQFFVLSYDDFYGVSERTAVKLPLVGDLNLLGEGSYIMPPNRGGTDSRYWVAPQILEHISTARTGQKALGLLVNNTHLNADILRYLSLLEFQGVEIRDLARDESGRSVYFHLFASDYVLLSTGNPYKLSDSAKEAVRTINESPDLFQQVYALKEEYEFPDGEILSLYAKRAPADEQVQEYYRHLAAALGEAVGEGDAIMLHPASQIETFIQFYEGQAAVHLLPQGDFGGGLPLLEEMLASHERIHAVLRGEGEEDPGGSVEQWLNEHAYSTSEEWFGDIRLVLYASPTDSQPASSQQDVNANLQHGVTLAAYSLGSETIEAGQILRLTLQWEAREALSEDYAVFVHLVDDEGRVIAQHDSQPVGASRPTTSWVRDEVVSDNHGLLVPEGTPLGEYRLVTGMYLPATGQRLNVLDELGQALGDAVQLSVVNVVEKIAPSGD
jgi:4-amino-4-deoxy-L-arabinose transferase-like glycosyltransferase